MPVLQNTAMVEQVAMNDRVTGFVLKQSDYREADVILSVLTKEYGKLSFVAQGVRKMTSKNAGSIMPYTKTEILFDYNETKTIFRLKNARCKDYYRSMHENITASSAAAVAAELIDVLTLHASSDMTNSDEYAFLEIVFSKLDEGYDPTLVLSLLFVDMLDVAGLLPDVDACVTCGNTHVVTVSPKDGGFLCQEHAEEHHIPFMKTEDLRRFRLLCKAGLNKIDIVNQYIEGDMKDLQYLVDILYLHADIQLKSMNFYMHLHTIV